MKIKPKSIKDWIRAILIALFLVLFIRSFIFESFIVKTNKMSETIKKGDYVFVNKLSYGARFPITILTFPFAKNIYVDWIKLPYFRIFKFSKIKHNDIIAINNPLQFDLPIDKKDIMFSRCIAIPGDTITFTNKNAICSGKNIDKNINSLKFAYRIVTNGTKINSAELAKLNIYTYKTVYKNTVFDLFATDSTAKKIEKFKNIKQIRKLQDYPQENTTYIFPQSDFFTWNKDNFGPLKIPEKGDTVYLTYKNIDLYKNIIENYENNNLEVYNQKIYINNISTNKYVIKQNYYFVADDNRDNANDSRYWGFLPESHIIGKVNFIWFSYDYNNSKIRWNRVFKSVN